MANNGAGQLKNRVAFDKRGTGSDGAGGTTTVFVEQFRRAAGFTHLRGGETVLAARLAGQHTIVVRVRSDSLTRTVTVGWQVRDLANGTVYAVRDIEVEDNRAFISVTCQSGAAS